MPATTTRMPRIVGYQRSFGMFSVGWAWARRDVITASGSRPSQATLVVDDRLDLIFGERVAEVGHAARRDPSRAVLLVCRVVRVVERPVLRVAPRALQLEEKLPVTLARVLRPCVLELLREPRLGLLGR